MPDNDSIRYDYGRRYEVLDKKLEIHTRATNNPHNVTAGQLGLDNVDNTPDIEKPLSNPQKEYIDTSSASKIGVEQDPETGKVVLNLLNANEEVISSIEFYVSSEDRNIYSDIKDVINNLGYVNNYMYLAKYVQLEYKFALDYFKNVSSVKFYSDSIKAGNYYAHNFDSKYNNDVEFIVKVPSKGVDDNGSIEVGVGRYATIGIASSIPVLDKDAVEERNYLDAYRALPFFLVDGMNEAGLYCSLDPVTPEYEITTGTLPDIEEKYKLHERMLVRFILDNFKSAEDAVNYIKNYVSVYNICENEQIEYHVFVSDSTKSFELEFIRNSVKITELTNKPYVTNFFMNSLTVNPDKKVYTNYDVFNGIGNPLIDNGINQYGKGLERYNLLAENSSVILKDDLKNLLIDSLKFSSNIYNSDYASHKSKYWYSDFTSEENNLDVATSLLDFNSYIDEALEEYSVRSRATELTFHTSHSVIYDRIEKFAYIWSQEEGKEHVFNLFEDIVEGSGGTAEETIFELDPTSTVINYLARNNYSSTFSANNIQSVRINIPANVTQGFTCEVNVKISSEIPEFEILNNSTFDLKIRRYATAIDTYIPSPDCVATLLFYCDGINLNCYIIEG